MIITIEPDQKIEIRFAHGCDQHGEPQTFDRTITVSYDDAAKRIMVTASNPDSSGRKGVVYDEDFSVVHPTEAAVPDAVSRELTEAQRNILDRIRLIISSDLGLPQDKIQLGSHFIDDLGADSLDQVGLVMAFEEEFGLEISDDDTDGIMTVGQALAFISGQIR